MILPLRRLHRSAFAALAVLLPALLASAWRVRRAPPEQPLGAELLPGAARPEAPLDDQLVYWVDARPAGVPGVLPPEAVLAGTVRSGALALPVPAGQRAVVYSLVHARLVQPAGGGAP